MREYTCIVGLDEPESSALQQRLDMPIIAHDVLPGMMLKDGQLWVEGGRSARMLPVSKMVFHGIFENDLDFLTGLALWGGPCLPNARAMMECRLKLPCLVRALDYTRFGTSPRGYVGPYVRFDSDTERVAKWGNWHCGENKARFTGAWSRENPAIIEHYLKGQAVRVVVIGDRYWQIQLEGDDWLKSIHHAAAALIELDEELLDDTLNVRDGFGLEIMANDYIVAEDGTKHLLEVNHIPNVTRFPEIWEAYCDYVVEWIRRDGEN
ncbi:MAG: hypothetical protein F9K46_06985 [Anaerolineae bacterium]|nr:MAG: hypothetical protein F9K46_06985 [Anaerolineae bacterium]